MRMRAELQKLFSYPIQDRHLFVQAWLLLLAVDLALRMLPFRKVHGWIESSGPKKKISKAEQTEAVILRIRDFVDRAARHHLYGMTCLRRSLALQWLLSRRGLDTRLQFGVRRENGNLQAHAWLEYEGKSIGETRVPEEQYARLKAKGIV
jgi:hypothetical protein